MLTNSSSDRDAITGLRAPTSFGRPNWGAVFRYVKSVHAPGQAGVFFCGPKPLGAELQARCKAHSDPDFTFAWGKENF
jgi:NADPH oxidase